MITTFARKSLLATDRTFEEGKNNNRKIGTATHFSPKIGGCPDSNRKFSNGHKIPERTISFSVGIPYRWDVSSAQIAKEFLDGRQEQRAVYLLPADPGKPSDFQLKTRRLNAPVNSYKLCDSAEVRNLHYEIRLIVPQKIADIYGLDPPNRREQLYCGCMAADPVMSNGAPKRSMSSPGVRRFPELPGAKKSEEESSCVSIKK